jgi:hypothetical protein
MRSRPLASCIMTHPSLVHSCVTHHIKAQGSYLKKIHGQRVTCIAYWILSRNSATVVENGVMLWMGLGGEVELEYL